MNKRSGRVDTHYGNFCGRIVTDRTTLPTYPRERVWSALVSARRLRLDLLHWRDGHLTDLDPCGIPGSCPVVADALTFLDALLVKASDINTSGLEWIEKMTAAVETDYLAEIVRGELAQFREEFNAIMAENRKLLLEIRDLLKATQP